MSAVTVNCCELSYPLSFWMAFRIDTGGVAVVTTGADCCVDYLMSGCSLLSAARRFDFANPPGLMLNRHRTLNLLTQ
jgi:hypothetical protein